MSTARKLQAHRLNNAGFSLIELLVVTGIIIMLVGLGIAGFIRFNERQQVEAAAKRIQTMLRTAQAKAQIREIPTGTCNTLDGYTVRRIATPAQIQLAISCDSNTTIVLDSYAIPFGIVVSNTFDSITFIPLKGGAMIETAVSDGASEVEITVSRTGTAQIFAFNVYASGVISEGGFEPN